MTEKRITMAVLAEKIDALNGKVDGINGRLDILNGRSFKNSTDIAKMKGQSGVIAFFVSLITSICGIYFSTKR
jgi:hypothetical protein